MFFFDKKNQKTFICLGVCLAVAGCAHDPLPRDSPGYQEALDSCRASSHDAAELRVKQVSYLFFLYPVSLPLEERAKLRECLQAKGYRL